MAVATTPIISVENVSKAFGHVQALQDVSAAFFPGEIVAIVGDNGAGKSTFVKILAGVYSPDSGALVKNGERVVFGGPSDAIRAGIATVYQDLALVDTRDVAANLFLGREPTRWGFVDRRRMRREARAALDLLHADLPSVRVSTAVLSGGQRQAVAIARSLVEGGSLVMLDEPTAALGVVESQRVLDLTVRLRDQGKGVILISHNLEHVTQVVDRVVVFNRGRIVGTLRRDEASVEEIVRLITFGDTARLDAALRRSRDASANDAPGQVS